MTKMSKRILFVCTGNMDRSPTAETLLKGREGFVALSAGTWMKALRRISKSLIEWSDLIFVMEERHKKSILALKPEAEKKVIVLDIPDVYLRDDPELIKTLKTKLEEHLKIHW
ncbi:MAG: hypothetical protein L6N95_04780 [Candidatus Methylarchaceae archaeon HK01B]|nr:hypothetical protein [Candidatus Methylarchaceae archaeon HK01M]MCP8311652.1 hypothetical protein [Candidatus Methylarchaceae archaeon HK02M1]MCP8319125.1 hypothetical protein [Candidatus Methylarchaceae archaeon HK01B]